MPRKKIALLRGAKHSSVEMLTYAPLAKDFDIETILSKPHKTDLSEIPEGIVIKEYLSPATTLEKVGFDLQYLVGAEKKLQKYDLVHSFELANMATLQAVKAKKLNPKLKVTATVWENIPFNHEKYKLQRKMKSEAIQFVDHFLAITERAKFALEVEGVDPEKISIVPVGIDTDKFSSQPKDQALMNELGLKESDRVLLTIARAVWEKGVWDLLIGSKE
ncbi:glycosyltransferase, partial [Patescibacteria group bacterium]|nr:glycosyltransferase [Patescibacteria group bacterium]